MIRCLAVDDEVYATRMMADYISKVPYLEWAGAAHNVIDALALVKAGGIDLVFLDIRMPQLTGIDFLKLCGDKCKVVLTTAYSEYALDGYEYNVIDYLMKPIAFDRFFKAAEKAREVLDSAHSSFPTTLPQPSDHFFIKGESKNKFLKVNYEDMLYIEGLKNYVSIFTPTQRLVTYQTLRDMEAQLPHPAFCRIHKSYIVNTSRIRMIDGNTVYIGDTPLPIGETYRDDFLKRVRGGNLSS